MENPSTSSGCRLNTDNFIEMPGATLSRTVSISSSVGTIADLKKEDNAIKFFRIELSPSGILTTNFFVHICIKDIS